MIDKKQHPALILVDIQKGFEDLAYWGGKRNNMEAEMNAGKILAVWRDHKLPVFHVKHCSVTAGSKLAPGEPGNEFQEQVKPVKDEIIIEKNVNSAFIGTPLKNLLDARGIHQLVILGLTTDHCISTTARMAGNFGYDTWLVSDATATFDKVGVDGTLYDAELIHLTALASLQDEFASIITTDALISLMK